MPGTHFANSIVECPKGRVSEPGTGVVDWWRLLCNLRDILEHSKDGPDGLQDTQE